MAERARVPCDFLYIYVLTSEAVDRVESHVFIRARARAWILMYIGCILIRTTV